MYRSTDRDMKQIKQQQGWTFWSLLFVLSVVVFFAYVGMQMVPVYASNENVRNAMQLSLKDIDLTKATRSQIVRKIDAQLYLDGSHKLLDYKTDLKVRRSRKEFVLETVYQREIPLFYNVHLLLKFDNVEKKALSARAN